MMPRIALAILMAVCVAAPAVAFDATRLQPSEISVDPNATAQSLRDLTITKEDWQYLLANMPADLKAQGGLARITRTQSWKQYTTNGKATGVPSCHFNYAPSSPAITGYRLVSRVITVNGSVSGGQVCNGSGLYAYCYHIKYNRDCHAELTYDYVTN